MDQWVNESMDRWIDGWMDGWMDESISEWMDGWIDGWMTAHIKGWTEQWIDESIQKSIYSSDHTLLIWTKELDL